jgi:hypothetical protein
LSAQERWSLNHYISQNLSKNELSLKQELLILDDEESNTAAITLPPTAISKNIKPKSGCKNHNIKELIPQPAL